MQKGAYVKTIIYNLNSNNLFLDQMLLIRSGIHFCSVFYLRFVLDT